MRRELAIVVGTRPEAIKLAPLCVALAATALWDPVVIATGQHRAQLDDALHPFGVRPDISLPLDRGRGTLVELNTGLQRSLQPVLDPDRFAAVVVQGDTASTLAGALVAYWNGLPLVHLEAGLRTGDLSAPWPEEGNRRMVSALTTLHLAPTSVAVDNLLAEGIDEATVALVGNTAIDAVLHTASRRDWYPDVVPEGFDRHVLVTAHRRESWGPGIRAVGRAVARLARANPDVAFLVASHPNPGVQRELASVLPAAPNSLRLPPVPYGTFVRTLESAELVLTDSGGIQEEAPALDVPVLVLRNETERPEGVTAGCARLVGTDPDRIADETQALLDDPSQRRQMAAAICPYGDGRASAACIDALDRHLGDGAERLDLIGPA